jgi:hypothetical protein
MRGSFFFPALSDPSRIGEIEADILIEEEITLESEVTEHPVEDGFPVSDHVIRSPVTISCVVGISAAPVTWLDRLGKEPGKLAAAREEFMRIYKEALPVTIVTQSLYLENMVMTSAAFKKDGESRALLRVPCTFRQIRKVTVKSADIPQNIVDLDMIDRAGQTEAAGGAAGLDEADGAAREEAGEGFSSTAYDMGKGAGIFK